MKSVKSTIIAIISLLLVLVISSCDNSGIFHQHTFSTTWTTNDTYHWHKATCEHKSETEDRAQHSFGDWSNGVKTCTVCKYKKRCIHFWDEGEVTTAATCVEKGSKSFVCKECGNTKVEDIPATGHTWNEGEVTAVATCEEQGTKTFICEVCKDTKTENIPANGHTWDSGETTREATTTEDGSRAFRCSICNATKSEAIPKILKYTLLTDDTYAVDGFNDDYDYQTLIIPSVYEGKKVTEISANAFANTSLVKLTISDDLYRIGEKAFENCVSLNEIHLPCSIRHIASNSFSGCTALLINVGGNITADTTFDDTTKIYNLTGNLQIKNGVELSISAGVYIIGNAYKFCNYGTITVSGNSSNNVNIYNAVFDNGNTGNNPCSYKLQYLNMYKIPYGLFGSDHAYIEISNCKMYDMNSYAYIWYPYSFTVENSYFENFAGFNIGKGKDYGNGGVDANAIIQNNTFYKCGGLSGWAGTAYWYDAVVSCWVSYGSHVIVKNNNFIETVKYALAIDSDNSYIDAQYNYFGTSDESEIEKMIYDGDDDYDIPNTIDYSNYYTSKIEF